MSKALEYFKKHPYAAAAAVVVGLIVVYFLFRKSSGSGGGNLASLAAQQNQGQLQLAQLNAQQQSQQDQLNAQLAATEYQSNLAAVESQNQLVGSLAGTVIPAQLQSKYQTDLLNAELGAQENQYQYALAQQQNLNPFIQQAFQRASTSGGGAETTGLAELAAILGSSSAIPSIQSAGRGSTPSFGISLPGGVGFGYGSTLGNGLFA